MKQGLFLWGTGQLAKQIMSELSSYITSKYEIKGFIDNNASVQGTFFYGFQVFSPSVLENSEYDLVVILTWSWKNIKEQIMKDYDVKPECIKSKYFFYESIIHARYDNSDDLEINEILSFMDQHGARFINYDYVLKYDDMPVDIGFDDNNGLYYVVHNGKRMYMNGKYTDESKIIDYYRGICSEQDIRSPHRYLGNEFDVTEGDVVVDAGVAEGNFALDVIDKVKRIYLIEADPDWIVALKETFKEYRDKVVIVEKFLSSVDDGIYATLDRIVKEPVNFIKMDIEGYEWEAIKGAGEVIGRSGDIKIAACAYHTDWDEQLLSDELKRSGFETDTTLGYLWFPYYSSNRFVSTKLHRGVIRASRSGRK